jgi:mannose-6-phosphate isomerase-like protein (cupin superfamily)
VEIVNRNTSPPFITKDGSEIRSILDRTNSGAANQSLAEATLLPGAATEAHRHPTTEEIYYILRGAGLMRVEAEERAVGPGDGILIPPGSLHQIRNTGPEPLVFLCCCAPPYAHEDTILESSAERRDENEAPSAESRGRTAGAGDSCSVSRDTKPALA